ncbi:UBX domain-containing protein 7, partial [Reticulomyxa filosa]
KKKKKKKKKKVKVKGQKDNKWILMNIQSIEEFASHALNRDLWKSSDVLFFIQGSFLLYQHERSTDRGHQMCVYYKINKFPYISIIDPHTGREEHVVPIPTADKFPSQAKMIYFRLAEWLHESPSPLAKKQQLLKMKQKSEANEDLKEQSADEKKGDVKADQPSTNGVANDATSDNVVSDNVISDNVISDNVISDNVISDNVISDNIVSDNVTSDNVKAEDVPSDNKKEENDEVQVI